MLEARKLGRKVEESYFYLWGMGSEKKGIPKQVSSYRAGGEAAALDLRSGKKGGTFLQPTCFPGRTCPWAIRECLLGL